MSRERGTARATPSAAAPTRGRGRRSLVGLDMGRPGRENAEAEDPEGNRRHFEARGDRNITLPRALTGEPDRAGTAPRRRRIVWRAALAIWSIAAAAVQFRAVNVGRPFLDAYTYFAAAKRLNVHHLLYQLSPGDLHIALHPPYWSVPILSPPFMAVIWRPLARLGYPLSGYVWMITLGVAMAWAAYEVFVVSPAAMAVAAPGLGYLFGSGNVHGFLFAALVALWLWRGRTWPAALLGVVTAAKVMPVVFVPWLISERKVRPLVAYFVAAAACTLIGLIGAGLTATLQFPGIMLSSAPQPVSLSYLFGVRWLSLVLTIVGMAATLGLRGPRAYQMAVLTLVLFNPSGIGFAGGSLLVLLALPRGIRWSTEVPNHGESTIGAFWGRLAPPRLQWKHWRKVAPEEPTAPVLDLEDGDQAGRQRGP